MPRACILNSVCVRAKGMHLEQTVTYCMAILLAWHNHIYTHPDRSSSFLGTQTESPSCWLCTHKSPSPSCLHSSFHLQSLLCHLSCIIQFTPEQRPGQSLIPPCLPSSCQSQSQSQEPPRQKHRPSSSHSSKGRRGGQL